MFDFLSYARDTGLEIKVLPPAEGVFISLEIRDPKTGFYERCEITDQEARSCANIDRHTGYVLDRMAARIGSRTAKLYADRHKSRQMREMEALFREA